MHLTDVQRSKLCLILEIAFTHIRTLASTGSAVQAADLADAFHNLPTSMWKDDFELRAFRDDYLLPYHEKYAGNHFENFVKMVDDVLEGTGQNSSTN